MKNLLKKVLTLVSALALLVSSTAMVYAEEEWTEAPVAEASDINAEAEALAAQQAEEAARIAAEEAAKKAAEEEAARIAAEEAAKKAAEEEAARIAAEEAAKKAAEEEAARIAAEEAAKQSEEVPSDNNNEETLSEEEEDSEDGEIVELSDDWGYVDPEIIADYVPEVTVELKYPDIRELKINEKLSGAIDAENDAEMFIRCGGNKTIVLGLYASSENVAVEINGNAVNFTKAEPATATTDFYSTYELKVAAGREYTIILSSSTPVSYKITADDAAKQTVTEETVKEETAVTEEAESQETENNEAAEVTETAEATETAETAETTEVNKETENTEEAEAASEENTEETSGEEGIEGSDTEENTEAETTEEEVPAVKGWITVDKDTFEIGDTITLKANADIELENMVAWQTKVQNAEEWTGAGYGETLTVELTEENINNSYRFRMEDESYSEEYTLTARVEAEAETETAEEAESETEETETAEENAEAEGTVEAEEIEKTEEDMIALGWTKVIVIAEEGADLFAEADKGSEIIGHLDTATEAWATLNEEGTWGLLYSEDEEAADQFVSMEDAEMKTEDTVEEVEEKTEEEMIALGYTKVIVTAEEGADLYAEADQNSEVIGHLDAEAESWVVLNEEKTWGQLFNREGDSGAQFISMEDAIIDGEIIPAEHLYEMNDVTILVLDATGKEKTDRHFAALTSLDQEGFIAFDSEVMVKVQSDSIAEDEICSYQWFFSADNGATWQEISDASTDTYRYNLTFDSWQYQWKIVVNISK